MDRDSLTGLILIIPFSLFIILSYFFSNLPDGRYVRFSIKRYDSSIIILSPFIVHSFAIKIAIFKSLNIDVLIVWIELYESG